MVQRMSDQERQRARLNVPALLVLIGAVVAFFTALDVFNAVAYRPSDGWIVLRVLAGSTTALTLFFLAWGLRRATRLRR